jgi:hypothetical protein
MSPRDEAVRDDGSLRFNKLSIVETVTQNPTRTRRTPRQPPVVGGVERAVGVESGGSFAPGAGGVFPPDVAATHTRSRSPRTEATTHLF